MGEPRNYIFELDAAGRPARMPLYERVAADIDWYDRNRASTRNVHPIDGIEGIVIHATAGGSAAGALGWWKQAGGAAASAHWLVPGEEEAAHGDHVVAVVHEALAAWHVRNDRGHPDINRGRARINHWTLGIEVVNRQIASDAFSNWQIEATAAIVRYAWAKYPKLRWVFSHAAVDPARRSDPGANFPWARFEALVKAPDNGARAAVSGVVAAKEAARPCCM